MINNAVLKAKMISTTPSTFRIIHVMAAKHEDSWTIRVRYTSVVADKGTVESFYSGSFDNNGQFIKQL